MSKHGDDRRPTAENAGLSLPTAVIGMVLTGFLGFFVGNKLVEGPAGNVPPSKQAPGAAAGNPTAAAAGQVYNIKVGNSPFKGPATAKVTIIEFSDYQCPFCSKVEPVIDEIKKKYGDNVRVVWKDFPLTSIHPSAMPAAIATRAMAKQGSDKFFAMHDLVFKAQAEMKGQPWTPEQFEKFASQVQGANLDQWRNDIKDPAIKASIDQDMKDATNFGVTGTPAFFVNGEFMKGAGDINKFSEVIDRQMKRADELLAKGIPADRLYAELTKGGLEKAGPKQGPATADPNAVYKMPVPDDSPFKGVKDAKVTIVEFSDYQCPFCAKVEIPQKDPQGNPMGPPALEQVMSTYPNDVKIVFRHNPLNSIHPFAQMAAEASMAAHEQGKFWEMHKKMFENQRALARPNLEQYAQEIGLNMDQFKAALDSGKYKAKVAADQADSQKFGSNSTPGFFVNGRFIKGAAAFDRFKTVIDEEIKKADALLAAGTPANQLYAKLTEKGLDKAVAAAAPQRPRLDPNATYKLPVTPADAQKGPADALVTIVEFSDFQCPFCSRAAIPYTDPRTQQEVKPAIPDVLAQFGPKVRFVFKHFPLAKHPDANLASQAALAAGEQGKFWEMHDLMFKNAQALKRESLDAYATQLGLDMNKFKAALDTAKFKPQVDVDFTLGQQIGVPGTPTFYINGKSFNGAPSVEGFAAAITAALPAAEALVKAGTAPKDVYAKIIETGSTAPVYLPQTPPPGAAMPTPGQPGGPNVIQLPQVQPGQPIVIQGGNGQPPVITTPPGAATPGVKGTPAPAVNPTPAPTPTPAPVAPGAKPTPAPVPAAAPAATPAAKPAGTPTPAVKSPVKVPVKTPTPAPTPTPK